MFLVQCNAIEDKKLFIHLFPRESNYEEEDFLKVKKTDVCYNKARYTERLEFILGIKLCCSIR